MINEYDRPAKGYKTFEQYDHPATVLYDNFAPKVEEQVFATEAVELPVEEITEVPVEEVVETTPEETAEEIVEETVEEEKVGEE